MFAPEDVPGPVHRDCINAAMRMSNRTSADRATANTQPNARRRASSSFPLQFHCVMIGRSDAKATTPPMCQVRDSGETGTILEMQRWLCDRHARRELALLFKLLPSDDEDEADLDVVGKSNEVQDLSLEGGSALLPRMSRILSLGLLLLRDLLQQHLIRLSGKTRAMTPRRRHRFT